MGWFCFSKLCLFPPSPVSMNPERPLRAGGLEAAAEPFLLATQCPLVAGSLCIGSWLLVPALSGDAAFYSFLGYLWPWRAGRKEQRDIANMRWDSLLLTCGICLQFPAVLRLKRTARGVKYLENFLIHRSAF